MYRFCAAVCFALGTAMPALAAADGHGDPLPEGAIARLGSARLRGLCESIAFSPDGRTLIGVDGAARLRIWDAASAKLLQTRRLGERSYRNRWMARIARSADGKTFVVAEGAKVEMWDLPSGKRVDVPLPADCKRIDHLAVSDDRRFLLLVDTVKEQFLPAPFPGGGLGRLEIEQHLLLWDTTTRQGHRLAKDESGMVSVAISADGKHLASSSYGKGTRVYDTATGKLLWREAKFNAEKVLFTPDSRYLIAAPGGGQSEWHVWSATTGQPSKRLHAPAIRYVWTFALSPDGSQLLLAPTETDYVLWDLRAGKVLHHWPGANQSGQVAFAPDGRSVLTCDTVMQRWDIASGKRLYEDAAALGHVAAVRRLFFTPDGRRLVSVGEDNTIRIWDVAGSRLLHTLDLGSAQPPLWDWSSDGGTTNRDGWTLSPDGTTLIGIDTQWTVHHWSVADGKARESLALDAARRLDIGLRPLHVRVTPDGKTLVVAAWPRSPEYSYLRYSFSFWDAQTGRLRSWGGDSSRDYRGAFVALSPDGRFVDNAGAFLSTRTGRRRSLEKGGEGRHIFAPDSRLLAEERGAEQTRSVCVYELATGRPILELPQAQIREAALSPDGRRFAFTMPDRVLIHDLATKQLLCKREVGELPRSRYGWWTSAAAVFSPDGRTLATGHADGTILLWDVPAPRPAGHLSEGDMARMWDELASNDPAKAYALLWRFQEEPAAAARYLRQRLAPVPRPADADWTALVRQLDSDDFAQREAASRRLRAAGDAARPALDQALREKPSLEQKKRITDLLADLDAATAELTERQPSGDELRILRAVAILEGANTEAARRVLTQWADGAAQSRLTVEAAQALLRLKHRPAAQPDH